MTLSTDLVAKSIKSMKFGVVVPTLNAGSGWDRWLDAFGKQTVTADSFLVIDSQSSDNTVKRARESGFSVVEIDRAMFDHGGTRQLGVDRLNDIEIVVFLTQDAVLATPDALGNILRQFNNNAVAAVCGRQLPRKAAKPIEAHARIYNYGDRSFVRSMSDAETFGLKTAFISNSFAAYRVSVLREVGGFPDNVIFGEDMYVAAKMLKAGYKIAYAADACVYHSHDYTLLQEFRRYFDMGVFHAREPWIRKLLGGAEGEGLKFVSSEFRHLLRRAPWLIPEALLRTTLRYTGFRLGLIEKKLPLALKQRLAMNRGYFS